MSRKRKKDFERIEYYYVELDGWSRSYRTGANCHPWEFDRGRYTECNTIIVSGKIRHIHSDVRSSIKYGRLSVYLFSAS